VSTHPNVILKGTVRAQGTTRALLRKLLAENREEIPDDQLPVRHDKEGRPIENRVLGGFVRESRDEDQLFIGAFSYDTLVMEEAYDTGWQISGEEGDLIVFDLVTYGYGEAISWKDLEGRARDMRAWAERHNLELDIAISANYW
jgi:hypothetical protein